jgi:hypothetical protein
MALPRVEVSVGITLNVGNYESVRADARFSKDCSGDTDTAWGECLEEAEVGFQAALDGVEKMLESRKTKQVTTPPPARGPVVGVKGPRRAGR